MLKFYWINKNGTIADQHEVSIGQSVSGMHHGFKRPKAFSIDFISYHDKSKAEIEKINKWILSDVLLSLDQKGKG